MNTLWELRTRIVEVLKVIFFPILPLITISVAQQSRFSVSCLHFVLHNAPHRCGLQGCLEPALFHYEAKFELKHILNETYSKMSCRGSNTPPLCHFWTLPSFLLCVYKLHWSLSYYPFRNSINKVQKKGNSFLQKIATSNSNLCYKSKSYEVRSCTYFTG